MAGSHSVVTSATKCWLIILNAVTNTEISFNTNDENITSVAAITQGFGLGGNPEKT